jgi:hypothetical protein
MTYLASLDQLPDDDFINLWNGASTTDEVVARVGRVPRWAVAARAVALRKAGHDLKALNRESTAVLTPS